MNKTAKNNCGQDPGTAKCTFEISVLFTRNATWQGQIVWAEKNIGQTFRSALEMLRLMDEALVEASEEIDPVSWSDNSG